MPIIASKNKNTDKPFLFCPYCLDKIFSAENEKDEYEKHIYQCQKKAPLISVIIPSRMGEEIESLESLKNQTYKNIEIIINYDKKKEGAAKMRNKGIKKAKGEFYYFCDNDLNLEDDCIETFYKSLISNPEYDWAFCKFYWDETLYNQNKPKEIPFKNTRRYVDYFEFISACSMVRASAKPFFDEKMRRFEDWDLWITLDKNGHKGFFVDKALFRTRKTRIGQKPIILEDSKKWKEILYKKHTDNRKIADIIIPHHNRHDLLAQCLGLIDNRLFNIIVASGGSFSENCNAGAKSARTETLIFLNDDTLPSNDILCEMASSNSDVTGVAQIIPKHGQNLILYGIYFGLEGNKTIRPGLSRTLKETHIPSGFCFAVKKKVWEKLKGLDEIYKNGAEDQDFGLRAIEKGYKISYVTKPITHLESQSEGRFDNAGENQEKFYKKWTPEKIIKLLNL